MSTTPRSSSSAGFSSRGSLLLVLAGTSLGAFLFVVLPRLSESRASSRRSSPEIAPEGAPAEEPRAELVQPQSLVEVAEAAPAAKTEVVAAGTGAKPAVEEAVEAEAPKLRYLRGSGQAKEVDHRDQRISNREQRKQRRENAARGIPPEPQQKIFKTPPERSRLSTKGGSGNLVQGKGKKPKDG